MGDGIELQVLQIDVELGLWVIRNRFQPGCRVQTHKHTGSVFAFTNSGSWKYEEYPEVNTAGSYLYEPAGSVHTLTVPSTNVRTWSLCSCTSVPMSSPGWRVMTTS